MLQADRTFWTELTDRWLAMPELLRRILSVVLTLCAGLLLLRLGRSLIRRIFSRIEKDPKDTPAELQQKKTAETLTASLFRALMYFAITLTLLSECGVDISSLLTVAGISGIAIAFGCQTLMKDIVSGLFLWVDGYLKVGDKVTVGSFSGTVEAVALRTTRLRSTNGNICVIPNGEIRSITNMTRDYRFAQVNVTVAHGQDLDAAIAVLQEAMAALDKQLPQITEPPQVLGVTAADARAATVRIEVKCEVEDCALLEREILKAALTAEREAGIKP